MKQPLPKIDQFTTDRPLVKDRIYLIQQGEQKRCCSVGSAIRMGLRGRWKIIKEFER